MSTKSIFASLAMAALVTPVFAADIVATTPTELKAIGHLAWVTRANDPKPAPLTCCDKKNAHIAKQTASNSAEVKATGHLAGVSRINDPVPAPACVKRIPTQEVAYRSPAELKAFGHLAARSTVASSATAGPRTACCATARCPMHLAS